MLEISRSDVQADILVEYPKDERFIKLPIQQYMELLGITPIASQVALINALNNPKYRFVVAALSRRQGKTYIANIIGQLVALVPGTKLLTITNFFRLTTKSN